MKGCAGLAMTKTPEVRHHGDRVEVALGVIPDRRLVERQVGGQRRAGGTQERVAVVGRICDEIGSEVAARPRLVLDHDLRVPGSRELLSQRARKHVDRSAGCVRHDQSDRPDRISLRRHRCGTRHHHASCQKGDQTTFHCNPHQGAPSSTRLLVEHDGSENRDPVFADHARGRSSPWMSRACKHRSGERSALIQQSSVFPAERLMLERCRKSWGGRECRTYPLVRMTSSDRRRCDPHRTKACGEAMRSPR